MDLHHLCRPLHSVPCTPVPRSATALRAGVDGCTSQPAPTRQRGGRAARTVGQATDIVERTMLSSQLSPFEAAGRTDGWLIHWSQHAHPLPSRHPVTDCTSGLFATVPRSLTMRTSSEPGGEDTATTLRAAYPRPIGRKRWSSSAKRSARARSSITRNGSASTCSSSRTAGFMKRSRVMWSMKASRGS